MAEITEVFDDVGKKVKKTFKNKPFLIACLGVGVVALILGYKKYNSGGSESEEGMGGYAAIGYAGYPTTTGGGDSTDDNSYYDSWFESIMETIDQNKQDTDQQISDLGEDFSNQLNGVYDEIGGLYDEMGSNVSRFDKVYTTPAAVESDNDWYYERQAILDQMAANSDAYNLVTDKATKDALHAENMALGEYLGLSFDSASGLWMDGGSVAYITDAQAALAAERKKAASADGASGFVSNKQHTENTAKAVTKGTTATIPKSSTAFDPNMDYQAAINNAIASGASASVINKLNQQRDAKIMATGGTTAKANSYYDANTDYQALINKAKASGASQTVIDNLTAQRNAKIAAQSTKTTTTTTSAKSAAKNTTSNTKNSSATTAAAKKKVIATQQVK